MADLSFRSPKTEVRQSPIRGKGLFELTHDWATTDDLDYVLACNCGSPDCRVTVTGKDWTKKELQAKYKGWFCWFIQRKIDMQDAREN